MELNFQVKKLYMDVLIVGGGLAGLLSALNINKNISVGIISKNKIGKSGNTIISGASLSFLLEDVNKVDSEETFFYDILESGQFINDIPLLKLFVHKSKHIKDNLELYGINFIKKNEISGQQPAGHRMPRYFSVNYKKIPFITRGLALTLPLLDKILRDHKNIKLFNNVHIIKILINENNRVYGAIGIDKTTNKFLYINSKVVIIASGGAGKIYNNNNNTHDITCDSYGLAYQAGALLKDMEFVQFFPTMISSPTRMNIPSTIFKKGALLKNSLEKKFIQKYGASDEISATRDLMSRAIFTEIMQGRGIDGQILLDLNNISKEDWEKYFYRLYRLLKKFKQFKVKKMILVKPVSHFFIGGIHIDQYSSTNIFGLLACGESICGIHGANRLPGTALSETVVFSTIAGKTASNIVQNITKNEITRSSIIKNEFVPKELLTKSSPITKNEINGFKKILGKTMWDNSGISRNKVSLQKALNNIKDLHNKLDSCTISSLDDYRSLFELKNMILTSKMLIKGALMREESRGSHYRSDFPFINDEFKGNHYFKKEKGCLKIEFKKS